MPFLAMHWSPILRSMAHECPQARRRPRNWPLSAKCVKQRKIHSPRPLPFPIASASTNTTEDWLPCQSTTTFPRWDLANHEMVARTPRHFLRLAFVALAAVRGMYIVHILGQESLYSKCRLISTQINKEGHKIECGKFLGPVPIWKFQLFETFKVVSSQFAQLEAVFSCFR